MRLHEVIAENRLKLSAQLEEMGEELSTLAKEVDKNRKQVRHLPKARIPLTPCRSKTRTAAMSVSYWNPKR